MFKHLIAGFVLIGLVQPLHADPPTVLVHPAPLVTFPGVLPEHATDKTAPGEIDCNSPAHWDGDTLYMFYSNGHPYRSHGSDLDRLSRPAVRTRFDNEEHWRRGPRGDQGNRWIEATHLADDGKLYMWYHNEPHPSCGRGDLTAPRIGQMVSADHGLNWRDQGLILEAPADSLNCQTVNQYFTGGNGDFCVVHDHDRQWLYFLISTYHQNTAEQGVSIARMRYADLPQPVGKVHKWHQHAWKEPGIGGQVTPVFQVRADWHGPDVDAWWGPSVHWNTHLRQWVMLLNRAKDRHWAQEGIYISFNPDIADPKGWSEPLKILDESELPKSKWYPQVMGTDKSARQTDKLAGRTARLFVTGHSRWEIEFLRPGQTQPAR